MRPQRITADRPLNAERDSADATASMRIMSESSRRKYRPQLCFNDAAADHHGAARSPPHCWHTARDFNEASGNTPQATTALVKLRNFPTEIRVARRNS